METRKKNKNKNMKKNFQQRDTNTGPLRSGFGEGNASTTVGYSRTPRLTKRMMDLTFRRPILRTHGRFQLSGATTRRPRRRGKAASARRRARNAGTSFGNKDKDGALRGPVRPPPTRCHRKRDRIVRDRGVATAARTKGD